MNCFNCGTRLNCVDSRTTANNTTWRRLSCPKCKEVYHSTETVDFTTKQEKKLAKEQEKTKADAAEKVNIEQQKEQIIDDVFKAMAKACVIRSGYTSAITGGIYESEEDAIYDTLNELKRIYKDSIVVGK